MWAKAHAEVGISPRTSPRVDCLRFLSPRANRPRKFHTATLSYTFQSVSISRTLNTPDSGVIFSSTCPMSGTVQQSPDCRQGRRVPYAPLVLEAARSHPWLMSQVEISL